MINIDEISGWYICRLWWDGLIFYICLYIMLSFIIYKWLIIKKRWMNKIKIIFVIKEYSFYHDIKS
jgi:hypothetical protein